MLTILKNNICTFKVDFENKSITGECLKDQFNLPCCYNKTKRGLVKSWQILSENFTESTSMYEGCEILRNNGLQMRTYCAMD